MGLLTHFASACPLKYGIWRWPPLEDIEQSCLEETQVPKYQLISQPVPTQTSLPWCYNQCLSEPWWIGFPSNLLQHAYFQPKLQDDFPNAAFITGIWVPFSNTTKAPTCLSIAGCGFLSCAVTKHRDCCLSFSLLSQLSVLCPLFLQVRHAPWWRATTKTIGCLVTYLVTWETTNTSSSSKAFRCFTLFLSNVCYIAITFYLILLLWLCTSRQRSAFLANDS